MMRRLPNGKPLYQVIAILFTGDWAVAATFGVHKNNPIHSFGRYMVSGPFPSLARFDIGSKVYWNIENTPVIVTSLKSEHNM